MPGNAQEYDITADFNDSIVIRCYPGPEKVRTVAFNLKTVPVRSYSSVWAKGGVKNPMVLEAGSKIRARIKGPAYVACTRLTQLPSVLTGFHQNYHLMVHG
ncbi:hypothetical protein H6P81_010214 [Aristolochia fimbriata]|uniref:Uncharacterized protein n=1 Tax=Aristolochia fimbriata TaxID=158543 RepID=A0AAV7EPC5_ARIFI|nr:hypothetical protein H6P81_010214 [Aristolochia fimbriata]